MRTTIDELSLALRYARVIQRLYDDKPIDSGFLIRTKELDDLCHIQIDEQENCILVAFAGTRNDKQWLNNAKRLAKPVTNTDGSQCHPGARETMKHFRDLLSDPLIALRGLTGHKAGIPVDVVGHSRGGFLVDEFIRIYGKYLYIRDVFTLGGPRTGNSRYNEILNQNIHGTYYRLSNNNDPVVLVPGGWRGYQHTGLNLHFKADGNLTREPLKFFPGLWDGLKGRAIGAWESKGLKEKLQEVFTDGISDHRLPTGYLPVLEKAIQAELDRKAA